MIPAPDWPRYVSDCKRAGLVVKALSAAVGYQRHALLRLEHGAIRNVGYCHGRTLELIWQATHQACLYDIPRHVLAPASGDALEPVPELYSLLRMGLSKTAIARRIGASTSTVDRMSSSGMATMRFASRLRSLWGMCELAGLPKLMQR